MRNIMKKSAGITIPYFMITTIVYAVFTISFELDNSLEKSSAVVDNEDLHKLSSSSSQQVETPCKSPCSPTAEMCIAMCA